MRLKLIKHHGIVLDSGAAGTFDGGGASFGCALMHKRGETYLFYSAAKDVGFQKATISLAISKDGIQFEKIGNVLENRHGTFCADSAVTPAIFQINGQYYMIMAGNFANAEELSGPWKIQKNVLSPKEVWEGYDIDCGTGICKSELLVYYSNVWERRILPKRGGLITIDRILKKISRKIKKNRYNITRSLSIAKLRIDDDGLVSFHKHEGNPLSHLNGRKGQWNESLFCPSYLELMGRHYLFTAASTYSIGPPFRQYIGLVAGHSPYFEKGSTIEKLIDGPKEKKLIIPSIRSEIALDTPSSIIRGKELWLYYAAMDRSDDIWKTALSVYSIA